MKAMNAGSLFVWPLDTVPAAGLEAGKPRSVSATRDGTAEVLSALLAAHNGQALIADAGGRQTWAVRWLNASGLLQNRETARVARLLGLIDHGRWFE